MVCTVPPHTWCALPAWLPAGEVRLPYVSEENHDEDPELQVGGGLRGARWAALRPLRTAARVRC